MPCRGSTKSDSTLSSWDLPWRHGGDGRRVRHCAGAALRPHPPVTALRQQSRSTTSTRGQGRLRTGLAATQLALALTLLVGAGVLLASFHRLQQVDLGFRTDGVLTFELNLPTIRYDAERRAAFQEELARRLGTIPGVTAAGGISFLPATGPLSRLEYLHLERPAIRDTSREERRLQYRATHRERRSFRGARDSLRAGRTFDARDEASAPSRAVVSASFARTAFPDMPFDGVAGQQIAAGGRRSDHRRRGRRDARRIRSADAGRLPRPSSVRRQSELDAVPGCRHQASAGWHARECALEIAALDPDLVVHRPAPMAEVVGRGLAASDSRSC